MSDQSHLIQYSISDPQSEAQRIYSIQRQAYLRRPYSSYKERMDQLKMLEEILLNNEAEIVAAIAKDFGHRPEAESKLIELFCCYSAFRHLDKHLKQWMKPQRRKLNIFVGGKNRVIPQPKGVMGIVVPWNYPVAMAVTQMAYSLAAGNRTMVKMAENSKHIRALLHRLIAETFDESVLAVVPDAGGAEFTQLPFDHILFTGSPQTGKTVMKAAGENLCPVTLELGGKSPVIVSEEYDASVAARRIIQNKLINAGQTCLAPDYVFVHKSKVEGFINALKSSATEFFPDLNDPEGYTSVIDTSSYNRLRSWLADAVDNGADAIKLIDGSDFNDIDRKFPPYAVLNAPVDTPLLTQEIFGPILPVITYESLEEVLAYIAARDRPLALYLFSRKKSIQDKVLYSSISGGVTINNCMLHVTQHDLPFGGSGASGVGHYHAFEGFMEFSKMRPVFYYPDFFSSDGVAPPYGNKHLRIFKWVKKLGF
jgi:coniferyl-aldehyde dehydrogenase